MILAELDMRIMIGALFGAILLAAAGSARMRAQPQAKITAGPSPHVTVLTPPDYWGAYAIWGATGSDDAGHVWLAITSNDDRGSGSAHLYDVNPATNTLTDAGNVIDELERLRLRKPGEVQMKIHSHIVRAADGLVYFASMDESGEKDDGSRLPTWGGHLWRRGRTGAWQHLAATREALIAVAAGGPYVYSVGYFNQVLYQFDTRTGRLRSVPVGAVAGHVSRNFFADDRGHAFVPRVVGSGAGPFTASLVEFDASLTEIGSRPLPEYFEAGPADSHGMVAVSPDGQGGWFFSTGRGRLYHETPAATGPATVTDMGWMHPAGPHYVASMFRDAATGTIYGVSYPNHDGSQVFEWLSRSPDGRTTVAPFPYGAAPFPHGAVLYGSMTRDANGRFYVVGSMQYKPVILQVTPAR